MENLVAVPKWDLDQIQKFMSELVIFHNNRTFEQRTDQEYYEDTFRTRIGPPFHVIRTGNAARVVDNIVAHIQGAEPLVYREPKKNTDASRKSADKVAKLLNHWIKQIIPELDEAIKNAVLRGEFIFQVEFNPAAYDPSDRYRHIPGIMPILITSPDPIITFTFPYDQLYPTRVVKQFQIDAAQIALRYPDWEGLRDTSFVTTEYKAYWDAEQKYLDIAGQSPYGVQENIYGFPPFIHGYSGLGKRQYDGKPEAMAVGKLRYMRNTLEEDCELASRIDSIIGLYANPLFIIRQKDQTADTIGRDQLEQTVLGPGMTVAIPYGWEAEIYVPNVASAQLFQHYDRVQERLGLDSPTIMSGVPNNSRTSGIQEDVEFGHVFKKYKKMVYNLERALEAALGRALEILWKTPDALPVTFRAEYIDDDQAYQKEEIITKEDIEEFFECQVVLNPENDSEDDRDFMKYRILVNEGKIPWEYFLIKGLKRTKEDAQDLIAQTIAEQAIRDNPLLQQIRVEEALDQMQMKRYKELYQQQLAQEQQQKGMIGVAQNQGYRPTELKNPTAAQQIRGVLSGRQNNKGIRESSQGQMPSMSGGQPFVPAPFQGGQE